MTKEEIDKLADLDVRRDWKLAKNVDLKTIYSDT